MATVMSVGAIRKHLENYSSPRLQKHIVRILWMPPVYAIDCFVAMRFNSYGVYLTIMREFYEAYCVHSFMPVQTRLALCGAALLMPQVNTRSLYRCGKGLSGASMFWSLAGSS